MFSHRRCCLLSNLRLSEKPLADSVIAGDLDYLRLVFLHELAHLKHCSHGPDYALYLNEMIFAFNKLTGKNLSNDLDYVGCYLDDHGHSVFRADNRR